MARSNSRRARQTADETRRDFLKWVAATFGTAAVGLPLAGCQMTGPAKPGQRRGEVLNDERAGVRVDGLRFVHGQHTIGHIAPCADERLTAEDDVRRIAPGVFAWRRTVRLAPAVAAGPVRVTLDFHAAHAPTYSMIPAIMYDGNPWGTGEEPKGYTRDGQPWAFAFHRAAVKGGTYSEGPDWAVGLWAGASQPARGGACSLIPRANATVHRLIWPEEETPVVYCSRDKYCAPYVEEMTLAPGEAFVATAYLFVAPVKTQRRAWRGWLDACWEQAYTPKPPRWNPEELWEIGMDFAKQHLWAEEGIFKGFSIGLLPEDGGWHQRRHRKYEVGWAGQNASLACSFLVDYLRRGNRDSLEKGLATLDSWVDHARFDNGLIMTIFDPLLGLKRPDTHDACNLGNAARDYLEAYSLAKKCGVDKPGYRELALDICDFMLKEQQPDGCYGRAWNRAGKCLAREGTIGAFITPAMIAAYRETQRPAYLDSARRSFEFYGRGLERYGFTTAGALDTDCIDKESAWPLIQAGLELYDLTGDRDYVRAVDLASYYTASWQYHHAVPVPPGSMFAAMDYDSFGGTAVSTQHHHVDPYAIRCVGMWLRLARLTDNPIWKQRALAAWRNGMIGMSDGTLVLGGLRLPRGAQCEGYFQTRWIDHGNCSLWLVDWPTSFRLELLRHLDDWSVLRA